MFAFPSTLCICTYYTHRQVDERLGDVSRLNTYVDVEQVDDAGPHPQQEEGNWNGEKLVL